MSKEKKDVICKGRIPQTRRPCGQVLYQSDGEYLYIYNLILNKGAKAQRITCDKCGFTMHWKQNSKYSKTN